MELVVLFAITVGVIGLAGRLPDPRKVKRALARARIQSIEQLADGTSAAIRGTVMLEGQAKVLAPLSGKPCVYWLVVFDEVGVGGDYAELGRAEAGVPFLLEADGARARVIPEKPRLAIAGVASSRPASYLSGSWQDPALDLARKVCRRPNYPTSSGLRATEYIVAPGMELTIMGWCTREPDPDAAGNVSGYRAQLPTRPVVSGSRRTRMLIG